MIRPIRLTSTNMHEADALIAIDNERRRRTSSPALVRSVKGGASPPSVKAERSCGIAVSPVPIGLPEGFAPPHRRDIIPLAWP
jgi:hypothetical protein